MPIDPQFQNIRATFTVSAAALTIAALTLTGCGQLPAAEAAQQGELQVQSVNVTTASTTPASRSTPQTGAYKPSATTAGVVAGTALKPYNTSGADLIITTDGAKNVTIKNSRLHGGKGVPTSNTGIVDANSAAVVNLVVQDGTLIPDRPSYYRDGIVGHDYTSRRNHIQGTNDGLGIFNRPAGDGTGSTSATVPSTPSASSAAPPARSPA